VTADASEPRPAFYALAPGGARDYVTLLHPPYTLWHLSYVAIGAALAPHVDVVRLVETLVAFFLALGIGAHALDELRGRPLQTRIPDGTLWGLAAASIGGAAALGIVVAIQVDLWLLAFVAAGTFLAVAYNLELAGGIFHGDLWFAIGWGAFPVATGYFAERGHLTIGAVLAACFAALYSHVQRIVSTQVRDARRRVATVSGTIAYRDGATHAVTRETLTRMPERALRTLTAAVVVLAVALLAGHVT
jgi:hypothetical protein